MKCVQFVLNPVEMQKNSKPKRKQEQFPNSERRKYYVSMAFGSNDDDDDDDRFKPFFFSGLFCQVCLIHMWAAAAAAAKNGFLSSVRI